MISCCSDRTVDFLALNFTSQPEMSLQLSTKTDYALILSRIWVWVLFTLENMLLCLKLLKFWSWCWHTAFSKSKIKRRPVWSYWQTKTKVRFSLSVSHQNVAICHRAQLPLLQWTQLNVRKVRVRYSVNCIYVMERRMHIRMFLRAGWGGVTHHPLVVCRELH